MLKQGRKYSHGIDQKSFAGESSGVIHPSLLLYSYFLSFFLLTRRREGQFEMRYYEQKYPEVDELVMVQVRQIAEMGAYVKLVRYAQYPRDYTSSLHNRSLFFSRLARVRQHRRNDPPF